jgi:DNA-binding CsgD family transcriptional regulator
MRTIEAAISAPDVAGIVVCGAAGVGKSRIVKEALTAASASGCEVKWAVGTASAKGLPLGAFATWAESSSTDTLELVRGVIDLLTAAPPDTTVIVGVDDAHLLDDLSAFVLHQIVQRDAAKVVVTVRDGEPVPAAIQDVWKSGQFDRLDLQPLSLEESTALLSTTLDGTVDSETARRLWELTRGNVLYLRNIVEQEIGDGRLTKQQGHWRWTGDPVLPPGLAELIGTRMGALPVSVSDVIDILAVGEPLELASLNRIADPAAVEEADIRGLITLEDVDGRTEVRVAHLLYGEVRRSRVAAMKLRRLRGLVAAELARSDDRDDRRVVVRRATLSIGSDLEPDAELLKSAARGAIWMWNLPLADRIADAAIRAGGGVEASLIRAYALSCLGRGEEADAVLADVPAATLTDLGRARLAFLRAMNSLFTLADPDGAKKLIDDASQCAAPEARICIDAFLTVYWAAMGKPQAAEESSENFAWDQLPDVVAARMTAWAMTVAAGDAGRTREAVAAAQAGYPVPIRSFVIITDAESSALLLSGQIAEAQRPAELMRQRALDLPEPQFLMIARALKGRAALGAGRVDTACSVLGPLVDELLASGETNGWGYRCQLPRTIALAMRGVTDEATAELARLEGCYHPGWQYLGYERGLAHAWVSAAQGAVTEAIATVLSAAETARAKGQFAAEVMCLQTATQFGDGSSAPRLGELAAIVEGPRVGVTARFATALAVGDAAELAAVSEDFEQMGDLIAALDAAAHAALAHRRADRKGSAMTCSARADELATRCGGAVTPALRQASERLPLTDREREILMLIGQGLPTRAIADRLTLSVRTVEGHIYRAMTKTGAAHRDELAAMLPRGKPCT